jgi:hypothetical protein
MRPIDTIKRKIDSDFTKYHSTTLCKIATDDDVINLLGVGMCAIVTPVNRIDGNDPLTFGDDYTFPVLIANRVGKNMESDIASRYDVLVLNTVNDRVSSGVGFLVSKTMSNDLDVFRNKELRNTEGKKLRTLQKELIIDD